MSEECVSPENGQVGRLHQHLHQRVHHLCVEDDGVHHLTELLVIGDTETGFRDAGVGLQRGTQRFIRCAVLSFYTSFHKEATFKTFSRNYRL